MKNKVILIHPKIFTYQYDSLPLAPLMLAATLEKAGFIPVIVDQAVEADYRSTILKHIDKTIYVGVSAISGAQIQFGLEISDYVRQISPSTPIVWGGRHASVLPEQTVQDPRVDIVVHGEGDVAVVELAKALQEGVSLDGVKGITYKWNNSPKTTQPSEPIQDLNTLPMIPWHLFDLNMYFKGRERRGLALQTGRGCPYSCTFCSHKIDEKETFREFKADYILDSIENVIKEHRVDVVNLYEPFFVSNRTRVREFCQGLLDRGIHVSWTASARANNFWRLSPDLIKLMKQSGCHYLTFGFESGSQRTLNRINKKIQVEDILKSVKVCHENGIIPEACFIVGFPFEKLQDTLATLKVIAQVRESCPNIIFHVQIYTAFPGSVLYNECVERYGLQAIGSLNEWGDFDNWKHCRPWLTKWHHNILRLLNGSIYASSLEYLLKERSRMRCVIPIHHMVCLMYRIYLRLFGRFIKDVEA